MIYYQIFSHASIVPFLVTSLRSHQSTGLSVHFEVSYSVLVKKVNHHVTVSAYKCLNEYFIIRFLIRIFDYPISHFSCSLGWNGCCFVRETASSEGGRQVFKKIVVINRIADSSS